MLSDVAARRRAVWCGVALAAGLALRMWFLWHPMPLDDDTDVYAELARNWFHHGVYGFAGEGGEIAPTLIRLPGYPLFLGTVFAIFGAGKFAAVLWVQVLVDLLGCCLIASYVREQVSERAGLAAIWIAALCPFTAAYSTIALTECLTLFGVSLALWATGRVFQAEVRGAVPWGYVALASVGMALDMLLRPDGVLLTVSVVAALVWYGVRSGRLALRMKTAAVCGLLAVTPLMPWTVRNWRVFHVVQPLAPRRVNDPGEYVTYGFYKWMSTWAIDIVSTGNVFWKVGTEEIRIEDLPSRAFGSAAERAETVAVLAEYNVTKTVSPALDAKFMALARERIAAHPMLCLVGVPAMRVGDMWLRPRTETLGLDADWWEFSRHRAESWEAVGLGLLNLALVGSAVVGLARGRVPWVVLPVVFVALRCLLLSTMENSEPRYTLEAFPMVIAAAGAAFGRLRWRGSAAADPLITMKP